MYKSVSGWVVTTENEKSDYLCILARNCANARAWASAFVSLRCVTNGVLQRYALYASASAWEACGLPVKIGCGIKVSDRPFSLSFRIDLSCGEDRLRVELHRGCAHMLSGSRSRDAIRLQADSLRIPFPCSDALCRA